MVHYVVNDVATGFKRISCIVRNFFVEFFFESPKQLNEIKRGGVKVFS